MNKVDFVVGIKAEQNLRELVRQSAEQTEETEGILELCPVGRKDWIAGLRFSGPLKKSEMGPLFKQVLKKLLSLGSQQRIRSESLRIYAVQEPVPVFRDATTDQPLAPREEEPPKVDPKSDEPVTCPVCERRVHPYNARVNSQGRIVSCSFCGGEGRY